MNNQNYGLSEIMSAPIANKGDILQRQRYTLFLAVSLFGAAVTGFLAMETYSSDELARLAYSCTSITLLINLVGLHFHRQTKTAYAISVISMVILIHGLSYHSGGVRTPNMYYLGAIVLYAYVVLESAGGKLAVILSLANIGVFYYLTDFTEPGDIITWPMDEASKDLNYLTTAISSMTIMTLLSYYLSKSKNAVIHKIEDSRKLLTRKNEELKELSMVASGTNNSVIITDENGHIEWVNDGFTRLTGYTLQEVIGKTNGDLFLRTDNVSEAALTINRLDFPEKNFHAETVKYRKDGKQVWVQENITRINDNEQTRYIFVENDITERKTSERKINTYLTNLEKTNKELDKFAYVVSHDLKAPLRAIGNLTGWIEEDAGHMLPDDVRKNFNLIKERVVRMESLINGILDYSKVAKKNSHVEDQDLQAIIEEVISMLNDGSCKITIADKIPHVHADRTKIQQVFMNIIGNAIKFNTKEEKTVVIRYKDQGDVHRFSISDNGPGIDPRFHEKIFQIFQTINSRDSFESTGVGLAIVKKIIDEQTARVWVESEPGNGTTFHFTWPKDSEVFVRTNFQQVTH
ncbi:MAG: sensor histidine kinase [Bacteroidota bacterium]